MPSGNNLRCLGQSDGCRPWQHDSEKDPRVEPCSDGVATTGREAPTTRPVNSSQSSYPEVTRGEECMPADRTLRVRSRHEALPVAPSGQRWPPCLNWLRKSHRVSTPVRKSHLRRELTSHA